MVTNIDDLRGLLLLLRENGVVSFSQGDLQIRLGLEPTRDPEPGEAEDPGPFGIPKGDFAYAGVEL